MSKSNTVSLPDASSLFARLLAEENLTVRTDRSLTTACFEPARRVLSLPAWQNLNENALLLFIAHEVGHALFTPADLFDQPRVKSLSATYGSPVVRTMINVVEDVRIERQIREKYRGLSGVFSRGYHALLDRSFFGFAPGSLTESGWNDKTLPDRINLYAKVGGLLRLSLSGADEIRWYNAAASATTFDAVLDIVEDMLQTLTEQQRQQAAQNAQQGSFSGAPVPSQGQSSQSQSGMSGQPSSESPSSAQGDASSSEANGQSGDDQNGNGQDATGNQPSESASGEGQSSSSQGQPSQKPQQASGATDSRETGDATGTNVAGDPFAVPSQSAADAASAQMAQDGRDSGSTTLVTPTRTEHLHYNDVTLAEMMAKWAMTDAQRQVFRTAILAQRREQSQILSAMIAAFRANQSAWQSRRVQVSRTGAIDPTKLAAYKLTDDLFLRRRSLPEAQNHGFVLHIDWSGSMEGSMTTVLWQVLHLIWFAESIKVPVDVYGFSDSGESTPAFATYKDECWQLKVGSPDTSRLIQLYSSAAPSGVRLEAQAFLLALMARFSHLPMYANSQASLAWSMESNYVYGPKSVLPHLASLVESVVALGADSRSWSHPYVHLGGTPLLPALLTSVDTVRAFRLRHRVEQCISVWLTDGGDTHGLPVGEDIRKNAPTTGYSYERTDRAKLTEGGKVFDPRSGKTLTVGEGDLSTGFALHRLLTGATVVCVDICPAPLMSFRRVLSKSDVAVLSAQMGDEPDTSSRMGRRNARRQGYVKPAKFKQTRKNVVVRSQSGSFADTGMLLATRRQFPELGCDAYLVTHPDLWNGAVQNKTAQAAATADSIASSWEDDDPYMTDEDRAAFAEAAKQSRRVKLSDAVLSNVKHHSMRKFADLLVPYMAAGRADATV